MVRRSELIQATNAAHTAIEAWNADTQIYTDRQRTTELLVNTGEMNEGVNGWLRCKSGVGGSQRDGADPAQISGARR